MSRKHPTLTFKSAIARDRQSLLPMGLTSSFIHRTICDANTPTHGAKYVTSSGRFAVVRINPTMDGTIEIDQSSGLVRVHGIVNAGMLREVLAAIR
jgi:hypothetical protein